MANKVQFGLKNVHYATVTFSTAGVPTYATPVAVPGAVSLSLEDQASSNNFYADDMTYYVSYGSSSYQGDLEMAIFPDSMLEDIWGMTVGSTSKVLTETDGVEPVPFALLFQIDGDAEERCYVVYNCTASRPALASSTIEDTKEPQTQSCTITALPLPDGKVTARTTETTPTATLTSWFSNVFIES